MTEPVLQVPSPAQIREELQELILGELLGPAEGPEEEVAEQRLTERYILGVLAPKDQGVVEPSLQDQLAVDGNGSAEEGEPEPDAPPVPTFFPSSAGLTFGVDGSATALEVAVRWGRYKRQRSEHPMAEGGSRMVWRRHPVAGSVALKLAEGSVGPLSPVPDQPEVVIRGRVRKTDDGDWIVTLFLVNEQPVPERLKDEAWLFQVELAVEDAERRPVFRRRPLPVPDVPPGIDLDELRTLDMLYRRHVEFAVGHGISVHAEPDPSDPRRAFRVDTRAVPSFDVPRTDAPTAADVPALADVVLDMARLGSASDEELPSLLEPLVDAYEAWIAEQERRIGAADEHLEGFEDTARSALARCRRAAARIREGISVLGRDPIAAEAFRFANQAMGLQRVRSLAVQARRHDSSRDVEDLVSEFDVPRNRSWRPFQLAFILLAIPALVDPRHPDRRGGGEGLVDLLWFPTGGGKTEAYLGLVAFVLAVRRLQGVVGEYDGRDGVAAIMRYTLRLLTIQQFQRAAALICACEVLRRERAKEDPRWDGTPFRIGLWVGERATPNTTDKANEWKKHARGACGAYRAQSGTPAQIPYCPWCGSSIDEQHIHVDMTLRRTLTFCGDKYGRCPFTQRRSRHEGLPVVVVDEEIYRLLPALLIGTVDKFAQLPWRGPVQTLFGRVTGRCERHGFRSPDLDDNDWERDSHKRKGEYPAAKTVPAGPLRPPDLIVQDELHLIAGPLGTMVGLYETAVDELCAWNLEGTQVRPKVIASTATVRRAPEQVHAVFWRKLDIFPPPGLDAGDSFFALQREPTDATPGRRYLGICAHGRESKRTLIRVYVAAMAAAQLLFEKYGEAADPWMTLVGYFNSLKDLGGMRRHVDDDVAARLAKIDRRGLARRRRPFVEELTSRRASSEIPRILDQLSMGFQRGRTDEGAKPIDVLLATNMISVGIDVPRLGLMVVAGQPKGTAEYIQATSRIGRDARGPGLVLVVYGWARPRDLSHYERFEHYHATFYRHVEALSVTPFAARALDRGLTALLVSLVRQRDVRWNAEASAQKVQRNDGLVQEATEAIIARAEGVAGMSPDDLDQLRRTLAARLDEWAAQQQVEGRHLAYRDRDDGVTVGLLRGTQAGRWTTWTVLTSLRDVEPPVNLVLQDDASTDQREPSFEFASTAETEAGEAADPEGSS